MDMTVTHLLETIKLMQSQIDLMYERQDKIDMMHDRERALVFNLRALASEIDRLHTILEAHHIDWTGTPPDLNPVTKGGPQGTSHIVG